MNHPALWCTLAAITIGAIAGTAAAALTLSGINIHSIRRQTHSR